MFMGLTIANVGGVPLASWVGTTVGWRTAFGGMAGIGAAVMVSLWFALPRDAGYVAGDMRAELRVLKRPTVLGALAVTVLGSGAMFTVFTYIAPILHGETHASNGFVTAMLVLYGVGLTVGNWLGGRYADRSLDGTLIVALGALTALLLVFAVAMRWPAPAAVSIFAWGVATFAQVPPVQMRVMATASDAPNLASSINIGAFNLGNALGAAVGGGVIAIGLGFPAVAVAGASLSLAALALVLWTRATAKPAAVLPSKA
jgi:DHA1 family inner membrane transport protein